MLVGLLEVPPHPGMLETIPSASIHRIGTNTSTATMRVTAAAGERHVLIIHHDANEADLLARLFELNGFEVVTAVTGFRAQAYLGGHRPIDVVVSSWDVGGDVYRWALQRRYDLRDRFVFVATDLPDEFDQVVAGRCLAVSTGAPAELVAVATAAIERRRQLEIGWTAAQTHADRPKLLVADDEPVLLLVIGDLLTELGYSVIPVESGRAAIDFLAREDVDVVVCDWHMDHCSGADVFRWITDNKPWMVEHVIFLSDREGDAPFGPAASRPMFRKGQDSRALTAVLREVVWQARRKAS